MKKNNVIRAVCLILAVALPFLALSSVMLFTDAAYTDTFLGELPYKTARLDSITEPKIVVIGGSSVAFGLDSQLLEEQTGMPVVNFGLYADLGTKIMLDLARSSVGKDDIVVIAPELDAQTLSLFFNGESAWRACEGDLSLIGRIGSDNYGDLAGSFFSYLAGRIERGRLENRVSAGVYSRSSFDEYGDIVYSRPYNIMSVGYDITSSVSFKKDIFSDEFIAYVNEFAADCEKAGASVVWSFPPVNASGIEAGTDTETYEALYCWLCEVLDFEVISNPEDYVMDAKYFYDTNFHPNTAGAEHHTATLAGDLRRYLGITGIMSLELPEPEEKQSSDELSESSWSVFFNFEDITDTDGNVIGLAVSGLTAKGLELPSLEVPTAHDGKKVIQIKANCFAGSTKLGSVTIRDNIESMEIGAFAGCSTLSYVHIYKENEIITDQTLLTEGAPENMKFVFHTQSSFNAYSTGYFWANYSSRMVLED